MSFQSKQQIPFSYPFGNPHKSQQQQQDTQSYHSVTNDDRKFRYFDDDQSQGQFNKRGTQSMVRKKHPLPPIYPYQDMKRLKQSMRLQKKTNEQQGISQNNNGINENKDINTVVYDNQSVRSVDSFHTVNEFQSICYEEGDYEKIVREMRQNEMRQRNNESNRNEEMSRQQHQQPQHDYDHHNQSQQSHHERVSTKDNNQPHINDTNRQQSNIRVQVQQSNAINQTQLLQLQQQSNHQQQQQSYYEKFNQQSKDNLQQVRENIDSNQQKNKHDNKELYNNQYIQYQQQDEKSVQISRIQQVLNQSLQLDQQILQLTKQLQQAHHQSIQTQQHLFTPLTTNNQYQQFTIKQQQLNTKYNLIQQKLTHLQKGQKYFTQQITNMTSIIKKTQQNNNYLQKQLNYFKSKLLSAQQKHQQQLQNKIQKQHNQTKSNINNESFTLCRYMQQNMKLKTYNIRPKGVNNQSYQSKKYKQLTFGYCFNKQRQHSGNNDKRNNKNDDERWLQLQIDRENNPPQYKIVYSFQQNNTLIVVRVVDLLMQGQQYQQQQKRTEQQQKTTNNKNNISNPSSSFSPPPNTIKKNYNYMIDFAHNIYQNQQQKLQSLTKQLIIHINQSAYSLKQFTKKIQLFLIITENDVYVDLLKLIPLPNPIVFYLQRRFHKLVKANAIDDGLLKYVNKAPFGASNSCMTQDNSILMKTYVIKIEHMADIESVQKLMSLSFINTNSNTQPRYFSIRHHCKPKTNSQNLQQQKQQIKNQLFYVKIQDCVLQSEQIMSKRVNNSKLELKEQYRYSLVFKVASNIDNGLLKDLIQFLTFLTVL